MLQGFEACLSLEDIARRLGRGVFAVEVRLSKLGRDATVRSGRPAERAVVADPGCDPGLPEGSVPPGGPGG